MVVKILWLTSVAGGSKPPFYIYCMTVSHIWYIYCMTQSHIGYIYCMTVSHIGYIYRITVSHIGYRVHILGPNPDINAVMCSVVGGV